MNQTIAPFARPLYVMTKPVGAVCNLACDYCYYLEKANLYKDISKHVMSDELLEKFIREYIGSQTMPQVLFTWHGGETLMRPLSFYKRVMELQQKYAGGRTIDNCIQTNGTLLTDEWCEFFKKNNWLVGVSIDGPQEFHDEYRKNRQGRPSFTKVMQGIHLLKKHGVEWNALAVVNDFNADYPLDFYHFFKEIDCHYIQFTPIVERISPHADGRHLASPLQEDERLADFSVSPEQWGDFLCTLFDEWVRQDVGNFFIQLFDSTLANWVGAQPGVCTMAKTCGHAGVMEFNGDVYSCDHFVFPEYKLGNIHEKTLVEMMYSERQMKFGQMKQDSLPRQCKECEFLFACNGECPKNRFARTADGEPGLNYLCKGYHQFFQHVAPYMDYMKKELLAERAPANIMEAIKKESCKALLFYSCLNIYHTSIVFQQHILNSLLQVFLRQGSLCHLRSTVHRHKQQGRHAADTKQGCQFFLFVYIHLIDVYLSGIFIGQLIQYRSQHLARTTPGGIEINQGRTLTQKFPFVRICFIFCYSCQKICFG